MPEELDEIESYRERFVGTEAALNAYYGENQLNRPAYVRMSDIIDTGIINIGSPESPFYHFDCHTSIMMFNCRDIPMGYTLFGDAFSCPIYAIVSAKYEKMRKIVYEANLCPRGYMDVRTMEQYYAGCCPKALAAEMMA